MARTFQPVRVNDFNGNITSHNNLTALAIFNDIWVFESNFTFSIRFNTAQLTSQHLVSYRVSIDKMTNFSPALDWILIRFFAVYGFKMFILVHFLTHNALCWVKDNEKCFENIKVITKNEFVILP